MSKSKNTSESMLGSYSKWAQSIESENKKKIGIKDFASSSFRQKSLLKIKKAIGYVKSSTIPSFKVLDQRTHEDLTIQTLCWSTDNGPMTKARLIFPTDQTQPLPGVLALHDHSGNMFYGYEKISEDGSRKHPMIKSHQQRVYEGRTWANALAKRGYVVLVPDVFYFGSRRVLPSIVPEYFRGNASDEPKKSADIIRFNRWAVNYESTIAKSLFCMGKTWPSVFIHDDQVALNILESLDQVDSKRLGCGGLSGGGLRSVYLSSLDTRIRCRFVAGFMSTWRDFIHHNSANHTWMLYLPHLPKELDFPEFLLCRSAVPTFILQCSKDKIFNLKEMKRADEILSLGFKRMKSSKAYQSRFYNNGHVLNLKMQEDAFDWFDQWLKG